MNLRIKILVIAIISFLFIISCNEEAPVESTGAGIIIPETTKVIDSTNYNANLVSISNDSSTLTFKSEFATIYNPSVNDILVVTNGPGMLRKITDIQTSGNEIILTTKQATLTEAIEKGKISLKQSLQNTPIEKVEYFYDGIDYKLNKGEESNFDFNINVVLYDLDGNLNTTNDQVKLVGNYILTADVIFEADIDFFTLQSAKIGLEASNIEELKLITFANHQLEFEKTLATIHFSPIYVQLGPLPVIITPKLEVIVGSEGRTSASLTVGVENTVTYGAGMQYSIGQGWVPYSESSKQYAYNEPELTANVGAKLFVKPEISLTAYGVVAGYANAEVYGEIVADMNSTPWWKLYGGIDYGVGVRAEIWSKEIFDFETKVLQLKWLIAQATEVPCPDTVVYAGKTYNTVLIGGQCWLKENLDVGTMVNGGQNQTNNGTIEKYCYDNDPNNCNTYGGLYQWNEAMQYSTTEGVQGICPPGWHLPTVAEFETLIGAVGGDGNALKAIGQGILPNGAGTNTSGFSALLAGVRNLNGNGTQLGWTTYFWSSTERNSTIAYDLLLFFNKSNIYLYDNTKTYGFSVRCLKNL